MREYCCAVRGGRTPLTMRCRLAARSARQITRRSTARVLRTPHPRPGTFPSIGQSTILGYRAGATNLHGGRDPDPLSSGPYKCFTRGGDRCQIPTGPPTHGTNAHLALYVSLPREVHERLSQVMLRALHLIRPTDAEALQELGSQPDAHLAVAGRQAR